MPAAPRVLRHLDQATLIDDAARGLVQRLVEIQQAGRIPQVALSGDPLAYKVLAAAVGQIAQSPLDTTHLGLWWTDDAFVPTDHPERHSLRALSLLAGTLHLDAARIHPIPSSDAYADPEAAAHQYLQDLGQTTLDICLLELGRLGQIASLFPSLRPGPASEPVIGITDAPTPPVARVSLCLPTINAAREVWIMATGAELAGLVAASFAGAPNLPSARVAGRDRTWWFLDDAAASLLPFHTCTL
jgi:6-phosphogluconolactonase